MKISRKKARMTNKHNISIVLAAALTYSDYDLIPDKRTISATSLMKPVKQLVKSAWGNSQVRKRDIVDYVPSFIGSSVHGTVEYVWTTGKLYKKLLRNLGYSRKFIDSVVVNPTGKIKKGKIPIYIEIRSTKKIGKYTISGKFDYVIYGLVYDLKSTSAFIITKVNTERQEFRRIMKEFDIGLRRVEVVELYCPTIFKYVMQGSTYKFLNKDIISGDYLVIQAVLKDWMKFKINQPYYPQSRLVDIKFELFTRSEVKKYAKNKLKSYENYLDTKDEDLLPECTPNELWQSSSEWKYFSNTNNTRATRNFKEDAGAAFKFKEEKGGVGVVREYPGVVRACNVCPHINDCKQADRLEAAGLLKKEN